LTGPGEAQETGRRETESLLAFNEHESLANTDRIMEEIWEWENLKEAMWRVKTNKGSAGIAKAVGPELGVRGNRDPSVGISTFPLFILFGSRATNIHSAEISPSICSRVSRHRSMASSKLSYHGTTMDRVGAGMGTL